MRHLLYITLGLLLVCLRQALVPSLGWVADAVLAAPACWLWLREGRALSWWPLLTAGLLLDLLVVRSLPVFTLASLVSLILFYLVVVPYVSPATGFTRLAMLLTWLLIWRLCYLMWLGLGWFSGQAPLTGQAVSLAAVVGWFAAGLMVAVVVVGAARLRSQFMRPRKRSYA